MSVRECVLVAMGTQSESQSQAFDVSVLILMRRSGVTGDTPLRMPSPAPLLLPTTSGSKQYGRPREEVLRELFGRCYEFADSLCRLPGYWTLSGVLLRGCRNRNHRRWHGYQQVDGGRFSLWGPEAEGGWTSREEQSLLDAIEQYGFGNWVRFTNEPILMRL